MLVFAVKRCKVIKKKCDESCCKYCLHEVVLSVRITCSLYKNLDDTIKNLRGTGHAPR